MTPVLGILCGMADEARALGRRRDDPRIIVRISAGRPELARAHVHEMCELGVNGLVSWGVCGGLDPALGPGDVVVCPPDQVLAADKILAFVQHKAKGAAAGHRIVDLESGAVADAEIRSWAIRVVLDEAVFELPAPALVALRDDGRPDLLGILWKLVVSPTSLPAMIGLARRHKVALKALSAQVGRLDEFLRVLSGATEDSEM